jgi:hypothetical protein
MKFVHKTLGLLLASVALSSCGGGGNDGNSFTSPPQPSIITLTPAGGSTTLPLNVGDANPWSPASPYTNEVDIHWTNADGSPVSGHDLSCSVTNLAVISIHILDDASTADDESAVDWGNIQVHSDTGHAQCWVFSTGQAGTALLNVGGVDPLTGASVSKSLTFTVQNASSSLPASLTMTADPPGVYFSGSNGNQSTVLSINVLDGGGQPVPNPASGNSGADNVLLEIVTNPSGNARLSANSVAGPVTGASVATHTVNGIATASFQSGNVQGPIQVRATSDRSDNNVTNGIGDPVSTTFSVIVSDGKLYAIQLTSPIIAPNLPSITLNTVSGDVSSDSTQLPPDADGTLSLPVTAVGHDAQNNPVLPGTAIHFGAVDEPVGAPGAANDNEFLLSGTHGDPQEGGTTFTATDGQFTTAGGGAHPGDTLIVFDHDVNGDLIPGNDDLMSALTVQAVNNATNLTTTSPFNSNDLSGALVNNGPVLPYLIGRGVHGSITSVGTTDAAGIAHSTLTYTVSSVQNAVAIFAQGDGIDPVTSGQRRVTAAGTFVYPGLAPAQLIVSPLSISGNSTVAVTACVIDALGIPLRHVDVGFLFALANGGSGSVDGTSGTGTFDHRTGVDGCATGVVTTSGIPGTSTGGSAGTLTISAAGQTADVDITAPIVKGLTIMVVAPNGPGTPPDPSGAGTYTVTLSASTDGFSPPGQTPSCSVTGPTLAATVCGTFTFNVGATVSLSGSATGSVLIPVGWTGTVPPNCTAAGSDSSATMTADMTCTITWGPAPTP